MAKKKKQFVWHKKRGKFISSHALNPQGHKIVPVNSTNAVDDPVADNKQDFSRKLSYLIKKAVQEGH